MLHARGIQGTRVLQGLLALTKKHACQELERACEIALSHGAFRLQTIRKLLARASAKQLPMPFLEEHPIIRPLEDYAQVVARASHRQSDRPSVGEGFIRHDRAAEWVQEQQSPDGSSRQGSQDVHPPRPGHPSSSCTSAELDSVSPDRSTIVPTFPFRQEPR
jgi:hypothetical protein